MYENIEKSLQGLTVDIHSLKPLPGNPRKGNVDAIKESYLKFGQLKPIVAVEDSDGSLVVIAGNHQLQAAKDLGWEVIAVTIANLDNDDAVAFALTDNKVSELGTTDNAALLDMISQIDTDNPLFESLGLDDFALASLENSVISSQINTEPVTSWTAPEIINHPQQPQQTETRDQPPTPQLNEDGQSVVNTEATTQSIVTQGSTAANMSGTSNAAIQFTLVFDNAEQQSRWYKFVRWLKMDAGYDGETTAERLLEFIDAHFPD